MISLIQVKFLRLNKPVGNENGKKEHVEIGLKANFRILDNYVEREGKREVKSNSLMYGPPIIRQVVHVVLNAQWMPNKYL